MRRSSSIPGAGGQARLTDDDYIEGVPELRRGR